MKIKFFQNQTKKIYKFLRECMILLFLMLAFLLIRAWNTTRAHRESDSRWDSRITDSLDLPATY